MKQTALWWLFLNLFSLIILSFFSMLEMACVSFNKVRIQYYIDKGIKRAVWLNYLLQQPSRLFGTTLIAVNVALIVGSECARQFHSAIGLNPDLAPLSQIVIVLIFGELAPMFAARRHPEHVVMLGIPIVYFTAKIMTPILWGINGIAKVCNFFVGGKQLQSDIFLSQDELQKILEEQEEDVPQGDQREDFNTITTNIFSLRLKDAKQIMEPIHSVPTVPSNTTIVQIRNILKKTDIHFIPIYQGDPSNIVGIALVRNLIKANETHRVRDYAHPPWFITLNTHVSQILKQFRRNNQTVAIVLNAQGKSVGIITIDDLVEEILGKVRYNPRSAKPQNLIIIDRTFPGDMKVADFNAQYDVLLEKNSDQTLSELLTAKLGHHPTEGESVFLDPFELAVKETSLLGVKSVRITTRVK